MYRKITLTSILGIIFVMTMAIANDDTGTSTPGGELRAELLEERRELKIQIESERERIHEIIEEDREIFHDVSKSIINNIKSATGEDRGELIEQLRSQRQTLHENAGVLRQELRENSRELRENFRERVKSLNERARIGAAHGRGLRMLNRFRAAIARFDHITGRLESRIEKLEERGIDVSSVTPLIEEAKNMKAEADVTMETLKAKYESLLEGENSKGIGEEAKEIALELKTEVRNLHAKLREIITAIKSLVPESDDESDDDSDDDTEEEDDE